MTDAESSLDAEFAALVDEFAAAGLPPWHSLAVDAARRLEDDLFGDGGGPEMAAVRDLAIDGPAGEIPIRMYRPVPAADVADADVADADVADADVADADAADSTDEPGVLVFFHGGVFVLGTLDSAEGICRELATRTGRVVLSVDYRLAPEHPFPAAVDDAFAAVEWARNHASTLGADPDAIGVAGSSAGGGVAAATALRAGAATVPLDVQVLLYPMLSAEAAFEASTRGIDAADESRTELRESYREHEDAALLSTADVAWGWEQYLRSDVDAHNPFAVPLRADEALLAATPPAVVATAGVDVLRDEGSAYVDALEDADVAVTHAHYPTLAHGFCSVTDDVSLADQAFTDVANAVRDHLDRGD